MVLYKILTIVFVFFITIAAIIISGGTNSNNLSSKDNKNIISEMVKSSNSFYVALIASLEKIQYS